jgi:hypothetical protein
MTPTARRSELNLDRLADAVAEPWKPIDVATLNGAMLRMARLEGSFRWHHQPEVCASSGMACIVAGGC